MNVADLPGFHNPFRCGRAGLFQGPVDDAIRSDRPRRMRRLRRASPPELSFHETAAIMSAARHEILPGQVRGCAYHLGDWVRVAEVACELLIDRGEQLTRDDIRAAGEVLSGRDAAWLSSLFEDPIKWHPGVPTLTNGQHRACGLWFSGADRVPVFPSGRAAVWSPMS